VRLLIATTHRSVVGGVETYLRDLLPRLARLGHELALLYESSGSGATIDADLSGLPTWHADEPGALDAAAAFRPDICYSHGLQSPALEEQLVSRFPTAFFAHNFHGTCVSGSKRWALPWVTPCDRTFGPACAALYYPCRCGGLDPRTLLRNYALTSRRGALLARYRAVLVATRHMREEYRRHGVPDDRLHLVGLFPPGVERDPVPPQNAGRGDTVLMASRLTDLKGGRWLVPAVATAAARLGRPLRLVVLGDGPERPALEQLVRKHRVAAEFHGWVDAGTRTEAMRGADVLAFPSVWPEPFGLVGIEAGCVGLPAVGFAVGGVPEWLRPGVSGELAPTPPTVAGLVDALVRALGDRGHHARLRSGAWQVAGEFTLQQHLESLIRILAALFRPALETALAR
jgi:glycosyltransferase involved in cell wall biosynthesis